MLRSLALDERVHKVIVSAGAIPLLVDCLRLPADHEAADTGTGAAPDPAAGAVGENPLEETRRRNADELVEAAAAEAACALRNLGARPNARAQINACGATELLVALIDGARQDATVLAADSALRVCVLDANEPFDLDAVRAVVESESAERAEREAEERERAERARVEAGATVVDC